MLRWLKTVVVSDEEKAQVMRQAGIEKTTTVRNVEKGETASKPECPPYSGMSLAGAACPGQVVSGVEVA